MMSRWVWRDVPQSACVQLIVEFSALVEVLFTFVCSFYTLLKHLRKLSCLFLISRLWSLKSPTSLVNVWRCAATCTACVKRRTRTKRTRSTRRRRPCRPWALWRYWVVCEYLSVGQGRRYLLHIISTPSVCQLHNLIPNKSDGRSKETLALFVLSQKCREFPTDC